MKHRSNQRRTRGFSLLELMVVVAITLVVSAMVLPNVIAGMYNIRLRGTANDIAGVLQQARFRAIRDNTYYPVCYAAAAAGTGNARLFFADISATHNCTTAWSSNFVDAQGKTVGYPTVELAGNVDRQTAGFPDPTLGTMALGYTPLATAGNVAAYFGPRGTPCSMNGNLCMNTYTVGGVTTISSYVMFLSDTRISGATGWAAITVSPAGRTKVWVWNGANWK